MKTLKLYSVALLAAAIAFISPSLAQKEAKATKASQAYVSPTAKLNKVHTKEELEKLGKLELTQIYMERIAIITELTPYIALHTQPGATLQDMGIPATPENTEHLQKEVKNKEEYLKSVKETLDDIIPYADKQNIIWSILFFEEMIQKMQATN